MSEKIIVKNLDDLDKHFQENTKSDLENTSDNKFFLNLTIDNFFKLMDKYGLTKTDFEIHSLFPAISVIGFALNPLPLYNKYLKEHKQKEVKFVIIAEFMIKLYIPAQVSKERKGRKEGETISKGIVTNITQELKEAFSQNNPQKIINDLRV